MPGGLHPGVELADRVVHDGAGGVAPGHVRVQPGEGGARRGGAAGGAEWTQLHQGARARQGAQAVRRDTQHAAAHEEGTVNGQIDYFLK